MVTYDSSKRRTISQFLDGLEDELNEREERLMAYKSLDRSEAARVDRRVILPMRDHLRAMREGLMEEYQPTGVAEEA